MVEHVTCALCGPGVPTDDVVVLDKAVTVVDALPVHEPVGKRVVMGKRIESGGILCGVHVVEDAAGLRSESDILGQGVLLARDFGKPYKGGK